MALFWIWMLFSHVVRGHVLRNLCFKLQHIHGLWPRPWLCCRPLTRYARLAAVQKSAAGGAWRQCLGEARQLQSPHPLSVNKVCKSTPSLYCHPIFHAADPRPSCADEVMQ